ncbi:MAG: helix-turn-helix transcriptional regulator [Rhodospirillales bacterium]|nr:helix-turn-helix transcriptional regulator [Rhodospirillales bacterium]
MSNKSPRIVSAEPAGGGIIALSWTDGTSCNLDLSGSLPPGAPVIEDHGYTLAFEGAEVEFSSPDLIKRAAWQDGRSPTPEAFRAWRKRVGLTQEQLADMFDLSRRTIGYYEDGSLLVPRVVALAMLGCETEKSAA